MLPHDIAVFDLIPVDWDAHAQHDAVSRTYTYRIHTRKDAFLSEISSFYPKENMDVASMQEAVSLLPQHKDYRPFCKQPNLYKNTICKMTEATLFFNAEKNSLVFELTANRFLRGMVRLLIGNILEVGYGKMNITDFEDHLMTGRPLPHFSAAYPQGLYLSKIIYPYLNIL